MCNAAGNGHLECLKSGHENAEKVLLSPWHPEVTGYAARGGHLDCLRYAHEQGAPWDPETTKDAMVMKDMGCLRCRSPSGSFASTPTNTERRGTSRPRGKLPCAVTWRVCATRTRTAHHGTRKRPQVPRTWIACATRTRTGRHGSTKPPETSQVVETWNVCAMPTKTARHGTPEPPDNTSNQCDDQYRRYEYRGDPIR